MRGRQRRSLCFDCFGLLLLFAVDGLFEKQTTHPPTHLLPLLAKALGVSSDQLLGIQEVKSNGRTRDNPLWRRVSQVEQLRQSQRKQIVQMLDAFLERQELKKAF